MRCSRTCRICSASSSSVPSGEGGSDDFDALLTAPEWEKAPDAREILTRHRPGPDDITQLIYTSGTTGEPKGVMHSANTRDGQHRALRRTAAAEPGRRDPDGLADGAPDRLHVRADDADHAARQRRAARRLGAQEGRRADSPARRQLHDGFDALSDRPDEDRAGSGHAGTQPEDIPVRRCADSRRAGRAGAQGAGHEDRVGLGHDRERCRHADQARRRRRTRLLHRRLPAARRGTEGRRLRRQARCRRARRAGCWCARVPTSAATCADRT